VGLGWLTAHRVATTATLWRGCCGSILYADHYGAMLVQLRADHRGPTHGYYLHVPFEETVARHATRPQANEYGEAEMREPSP
jgi:hypothetical protein